ncbi:Sugar transporter SWEET1 [Phytophthora citrophthora]|uniref:Sugar transporter SWEET1 n=1 Tax=Phytophthora citrophthora TaxID=4793 RepID=A0AAD9LMU9_9STRA|nr:Sugar transporter SWEET1 [Phytophthora citrophthora]
MMYGYLAKIYFPVFSCFLVGDFAAIIYLTIYYRYSDNRRYVVRSITTVTTILFILTFYVILGGFGATNQTRHEVSTVLGFFADFASVCLYCAPMEKLYMVLKHKSAAFINLPMVLAGYMNNIIWLTFGSLIQNYFMISINIFFFTMNSFTLVVYHIYDPKTHPLEEGWDKKVMDENENTEKYPLKEGETFLNEDDQDEEFVVIQVSDSLTSKKIEVPSLEGIRSPAVATRG